MKQRAIIAMSLTCDPDLIIADEPTTALDVVIQDRIFHQIKDLQKKLNFSFVLISHDLSIVAETCDKIAVMYAGTIFEYADSESIFTDSRNPYTWFLLHSIPSIRGPLRRLTTLPGTNPSLLNPPKGCRFEPRCPFAKDICSEEPPSLVNVGAGEHYSLCHYASDIELRENRTKRKIKT